MNVRLIFVLVLILVFSAAGDATERLSLHVSPAVAFAPATITIRAMVESDPENHAIAITAESADFYRSSTMSLDGDRAPRTTLLELRALPMGSYEVKATLFGPGGARRAVARRSLNVVSTPRGE